MTLSDHRTLDDLVTDLGTEVDLDELRSVFGFSPSPTTAIPNGTVIRSFGDDALIRLLTTLSTDRSECSLIQGWSSKRWNALLTLADQISGLNLVQFSQLEIDNRQLAVGQSYTSLGISVWPPELDNQPSAIFGWRLIRSWVLALRYEQYPDNRTDAHVAALAKEVFKLLRRSDTPKLLAVVDQHCKQLTSIHPSEIRDLLLECVNEVRDSSDPTLQRFQASLRGVDFDWLSFRASRPASESTVVETGVEETGTSQGTESNSNVATTPGHRYFLKTTSGESIRVLEKPEIEGSPFSYNSFSPMEHSLLDEWLASLINSDSDESRLFGVLFWMSRWLGQSITLIMRIPISSHPKHSVGMTDWVLNPSHSRLERSRVVRRNGWTPDAATEPFLVAYADLWAIDISETPAAALLAWVDQLGDIEYVGDIWAELAGNTKPSTFFDRNKPPLLHHRNISALAGTFHQLACETGVSAKKVRLLAANCESALPAGLAYTAVTLAEAQQVFRQPAMALDAPSAPTTTVAGSYKVVRQDALQALFDDLRDSARDHQGDWSTAHNRMTFLVVAHLMFGTGPRAINSPFESSRWFSPSDGWCYIEDKVSGVRSKGRMTPLGLDAAEIVVAYLKYLERLASSIEIDQPEVSASIRQLVDPDGEEDAAFPLFFLVDDTGRITHLTVSDLESAHPLLGALGANLFRHHFEQRLTAAGVPSQVVEGWMGHSERKRQTYGRDSLRCFADDVQRFGDQINQANADIANGADNTLDLMANLPWRLTVPTLTPPTKVTGSRARALQRKNARLMARTEVRELIETFGSKGCEPKNPEELERLVLAATHKGIGLDGEIPETLAVAPHTKERLAVLREAFPKHSDAFRESPTVRRLTNLLNELPSTFTPDAALAPQRLRRMQAEISNTAETSRCSAMGRAIVACMRIAVLYRVSDRAFFRAILAGTDYRLAEGEGAYFVEYWPELDDRPRMGVASIQIDAVTSRWLKAASKEKRFWRKDTSLPMWVKSLLGQPKDLSEASFWSAFSSTLKTIRSANQVEWPGQLAYLSDNLIESAGLPLGPEQALYHGRLYVPAGVDQIPPEHLSFGPQPHLSEQDFKRGTKRLKDIVGAYKKSEPEATVQALEVIIQERKLAPFSSVVAVWISQLIRRGKQHGGGAFADSSPARYLADVTTRLSGFEDQQLFALDSESATDLLKRIVMGPDGQSVLPGAVRVAAMFEWAEEMGGPEIDWERLPSLSGTRRVRAMICSEHNYVRLLSALWAADEKDQRVAFALIMWRKFGLRLGESQSLMRRNLLFQNDRLQVTVEHRGQRPAKSQSGYRCVPLIFTLSALELEICKTLINRWHAHWAIGSSAPILGNADGQYDVELEGYARDVIREISHGAWWPHGFRHDFANLLFGSIASTNSRLLTPIVKGVAIDRSFGSDIRASQTNEPDMAAQFGQLIGHAGGGPMRRNYNHQLFAWRDALLGFNALTSASIDLNEGPDFIQPAFVSATNTVPSLQQRVQCLINLASGQTVETSGHMARVPVGDARELIEAVGLLAESGRFNKTVDSANELLSNLPKRFYRALMAAAPEVQVKLALAAPLAVDPFGLAEAANSERDLELLTSDEVTLVCSLLEALKIDTALSTVQAAGRNASQLEAVAAINGMTVKAPTTHKRGRRSSGSLLVKVGVPKGHPVVANRLQFLVTLILSAQVKQAPAAQQYPSVSGAP